MLLPAKATTAPSALVKRPYASSVLRVHGDLASLTRNGLGSKPESDTNTQPGNGNVSCSRGTTACIPS